MGEQDTLGRLFDKLDSINERLARVETMISERNKRLDELEKEVKALKENQSILSGARGIFAWIVATGIAIWGAIK